MFLFPLTLTEKKIQNTTNQALKCAENRKKHQENINNIEHLFKYHNKRSNITVKRPLSINIRKKNLTKKTMWQYLSSDMRVKCFSLLENYNWDQED